MRNNDYQAWDECPDVDECELVFSFLKLVDDMVKDIQHLKAETIRARYELAQQKNPENNITSVDILSGLEMPHYDSLAYQEYTRLYYDGGDPMSFKKFTDSMAAIANGIDDEQY